MKSIVRLFLITVFFASCGDSNSIPKVDSEEVAFVSDSLKVEVETPIKEDSIIEKDTPFLDIAFLEKLESNWKSSYRNAKLVVNGFTRKSSDLEEEKVYENKALGNKLVLCEELFHGGGSQFIVVYKVSEEQFELFTASLVGTSYRVQVPGFYKKKGLGTYVERTIRMRKKDFAIIYVHYVGKEASMPPFVPMDSLPVILPIDSILRM